MSVPANLLGGAAVLTGGTMLAIGGINNQTAFDVSGSLHDSDDGVKSIVNSADNAGIDATALTHAHGASTTDAAAYGHAANSTLALGGMAVLTGVAALALRGNAAPLRTVAGGLAAISALSAGGMGMLGWHRYHNVNRDARTEKSTAQQVIDKINNSSTDSSDTTDTTRPGFRTRDGEHILERDERIAARVPYDPSPTYARHTETTKLSNIAERDLEPLAPSARYAAVVKGLDDIDNELDFWGHDCQEPFAEAAGVSLRADGSVNVQDAMRSIDTNGDKRLSLSEIQQFERRAELVANADEAAIADMPDPASSQGSYGGSTASDD